MLTLSLTERGRKHKHQRETTAESVTVWATQIVVHFVLPKASSPTKGILLTYFSKRNLSLRFMRILGGILPSHPILTLATLKWASHMCKLKNLD